jgi:formylglycine-generating enzyme required for sulfatase activity
MKLIQTSLTLGFAAVLAQGVLATPTVTIDSVAQRWPWNNKVDITYTVGDGTDLAAFDYYKIVFTATVEGTEYTIDGSKDIIAKTVSGTHTVTWTNAPAGVRAADCRMGAKLYRTSGYYMIVDLDTGAFAFDGLEESDIPTAVPTASNARYNTDLYKTDRLVLRRIPRTSNADAAYLGGYPTGHADYTYNQPTNWTTAADYFIGVFDMTVAQYRKIMGQTASTALRPQGNISWNTLRASASPATTLGSNASSGSVFERLNALSGLRGFDLPTSVMHEIADRAGVTGRYFWNGNHPDWGYWEVDSSLYPDAWASYYVYQSASTPSMPDVAAKGHSNVWGLFDTTGNIMKMFRDGNDLLASDLTAVPDAFTPAPFASGSTSYLMKWTAWALVEGDEGHRASHRTAWGCSDGNDLIGFRVSFRNMAP